MAKITAERLRELLDYDPLTGVFTRKTGRQIGKIAGTWHVCGYWQILVDGTVYLAHRLAWLYMTGEWPIDDVDHANRQKRDNRFSNLRAATRSQNMSNVKYRRDASGKTGAHFHRHSGLWHAEIRAAGKRLSLGYFKTSDEAAAAYRAAVIEHHGEFARVV